MEDFENMMELPEEEVDELTTGEDNTSELVGATEMDIVLPFIVKIDLRIMYNNWTSFWKRHYWSAEAGQFDISTIQQLLESDDEENEHNKPRAIQPELM